VRGRTLEGRKGVPRMSERYVVGIDGSGPSDAALEWAVQRAVRDGRSVVLAHVDDGPEVDDLQRGEGRDLLGTRTERMRRLHPNVRFEPVLAHGSPVWELARITRRDDVLVIGTHKTGYLNGRVMGSRSVQIAMATDCNVAVIPAIDLRFRRGVVVGIDRPETAMSLGRIAAQEAEDRHDDLLLVHCSIETGGALAGFDLPISVAVEAAQLYSSSLRTRTRVTERQAAAALLDSARGKALLILGPGSLDPSRSPLGSVMHDVLLNANAPVLIARAVLDGARDIPIAASRARG
jgi:nucleotide-binding universal stress UspA family protein